MLHKKKSNRNNKFIAQAWNDKLELLDGSQRIVYFQNYLENYQKHETLPTKPQIQIYIHRINNRITIKILKTGAPETMIYLVAIKITLIKKKGIKMYQIQKLVKFFQFFVTLLISFIYFCTKQIIWTIDKYITAQSNIFQTCNTNFHVQQVMVMIL